MANAIAPEHTVLYRDNPRAGLVVSVTYGWQAFNLNQRIEPFRDERVRRAFRLLVDRRELVARVLNGEGRVANDLYAPQDPTFNHHIPQRETDLAEARSLLKSAGHERLSVEAVVPPAGVSAALVLAEQAKRVGVEIKVKKVDLPTYNGPTKNSFAISTGSALGQSFLCTGLNQDAPLAVTNRTGFDDARFGSLFLQALKVADLERRRPLVQEAQQIQHDRGGLVIWGFANALDAIAPRVGGVQPEHSHFPTWRFDSLWLRGGAA